MSKSFNQVTILGTITRDLELKSTPNGQSVLKLSLALNSSYKDKDGQWKDRADFIDVVAWANLAENIAKYKQKGQQLLVSGKLQQSTWEQDGQKRSKVEVVAQDVNFIGSHSDSSTASSSSYGSTDTVISDISDDPIDLSEIPF